MLVWQQVASSRAPFPVQNVNGPAVESFGALMRPRDANDAELTEFGESSNEVKRNPFLERAVKVKAVQGRDVDEI